MEKTFRHPPERGSGGPGRLGGGDQPRRRPVVEWAKCHSLVLALGRDEIVALTSGSQRCQFAIRHASKRRANRVHVGLCGVKVNPWGRRVGAAGAASLIAIPNGYFIGMPTGAKPLTRHLLLT